jgi:hypothetical protein
MGVKWTSAELRAHQEKELSHSRTVVTEKPNKYRNKVVEAHGRKFDSKKEAARYLELTMMEKAGLITNLQCQKEFILSVNGFVICKYIADFVYTTLSMGANDIPEPDEYVVEDVKSKFTRTLPVYRIKKKLMEAIDGIIIKEV